MSYRLAFALSAPVAIAIAGLAGCSAGSVNSSGEPPSSSPMSTAPVSPTAASSTPAALRTLAPSPSTTLLKVAAGDSVMLSGSGCKPGAGVVVWATANHATDSMVGGGNADASGKFSVTAIAPNLGQPEATLVAQCDNPSATTITADQTTIEYVPAPAPTTPIRIALGSKYTVTGGGCKPGAAVIVIATASHATGTTVGQGTADASGKFSVAATAPNNAQPDESLVAQCDSLSEGTITVASIEYTVAG